ncbi:MAG: RecX family transcriptional regulator [Dehalococcoidia bacterium]|jgi:regulatory protein|nr:RecX family transcriptional regulator [Chloroflexota bacterium]MCK4243203.1 RecX family transcriptional regulator [Dehalococcoidia bacterium]
MRTITAIEAQKRGRNRVNVLLDGTFAFSLGIEVVEEQGLHLGQVLSDAQIEELASADLFRKCLNAVLRFLSYRPRSEAEIRTRLGRRFEGQTIDRVILHLKSGHMVDDVAFAQFWMENRESFSPRSKRMLKLELRRKGIDSDVIADVVGEIDDEEGAYRAAGRRARSWAKEDYNNFRLKLGAFLRRRGFSYEVANRAVERLWQESRK